MRATNEVNNFNRLFKVFKYEVLIITFYFFVACVLVLQFVNR